MITSKVLRQLARVRDRLPVAPRGPVLRDKLVLVDVGASGGLQRKWLPYRRSLAPVLFEPNAAEAAKLRDQLGPEARIIEVGLSDRAGPHILHIARFWGCTSMLKANAAFLAEYEIGELYVSDREVTVACSRYDDLLAAGDAPQPDVIKIDIEGFESRALSGFGESLWHVLGIETEAWLYPAFRDQALLHQLTEQLAPFDLRLRRLEPVSGFEGDLVCVNAYFTIARTRSRALDAAGRAKFALLSRVWQLEER